jgi:hypothetical protein
MVLHDLHGLTTRDVTGLLDLPEASVRTRLFRARRLVRSRWSPPLAAALLAIPWLVADGTRGAVGGHAVLATTGVLMKTSAVPLVAASLLAAAVGLGIGMFVHGSDDSADRARRAEQREKALAAEVAKLREEAAALRAAAEGAGAKTVRTAEGPALVGAPKVTPGLAPGETPAPPVDAAPKTAGAPVVPTAPQIRIPAHDESLAEIDWGSVGNSVWKMRPLMDSLGESTARGDSYPPELGQVVVHNGQLVVAALKFEKSVKTGNPNSAYTHPAFMSNAIAATLAAAALPLDDAQARALGDLSVQFTLEDEQRRKAYGDKTFELAKVCDEGELRDRFFSAAFGVLTPQQREALSGSKFRGRVAIDLFSSGLLWQIHTKPLPFDSVDDLVEKIVEELTSRIEIGWTDEQREELKRLVSTWVTQWPGDATSRVADAYSLAGMPLVSWVLECGRRQLPFLESLPVALGLTPAKAAKVREMSVAIVPLRKAAGAN